MLRPKPKSFLASAILICLLCLAPRSNAQDASGSISILPQSRATDFRITGQCLEPGPQQRAVVSAKVVLIALEGPDERPHTIAETPTDGNGTYEFTGLIPPSEDRLTGRKYLVVATAPNHASGTYYVPNDRRNRVQQIPLFPDQAILRGKVTDVTGAPIHGAEIRQFAYASEKLTGLPSCQSNPSGLYLLGNLPVVPLADRLGRSFTITISHPDYPTSTVTIVKCPDVKTFQLEPGCVVTGCVQSDGQDQSLADLLVTAAPSMNANLTVVFARTDEHGRFRMVVKPGSYNFLLEADTELVSAAMTNVACVAGQNIELEPFRATAGGWITGQLINPETERPVVRNPDGDRIAIGFYGPSRPPGNSLDTHFLCRVDDNGNFKMRAAPGENFPYLCNLSGERNVWNTKQQAPVIVEAGQTTPVVMHYVPEKLPEQKMDIARRIVDTLPVDPQARTVGIIAEFRKLNHTVDETEVWCLLMQELVAIGKPAVLPLCKEFEATDEQRMMRRLAFALRAIGDPRAVPTLIRVLPKTLQPPMSDYGLIVEDQNLLKFMQDHSLDQGRGGTHFSFGRPIRETHAALVQLTGRKEDGGPLATTKRSDDPRAQAIAERLYYDAAQDWTAWWESHWQESGVSESFSKVNLPAYVPPDLAHLPHGLELTENAKLGDRWSGTVLTPIGDADPGATYFLDLDTKRRFHWPQDFEVKATSDSLTAIKAWARQQGADLMCVHRLDQDGNSVATLTLVGMTAWEIDPSVAAGIDKIIQKGAIPTGRAVEEYLQHASAEVEHSLKTEIGSSFLYLTSEEGLGVITITDIVTEARDISGLPASPQGVGFHRGVRFDHVTILR